MTGDPWDSPDMLDDDDFVDGVDDESGELGVDYHDADHFRSRDPAVEDAPAQIPPAARAPQAARPPQSNRNGSRPYRMRPMSDAMRRRFPTMKSMLATFTDGRQVLFIRKG